MAAKLFLALSNKVLMLLKPVSRDVKLAHPLLPLPEFLPPEELLEKFGVKPTAVMPKPEDVLILLVLFGVVYHVVTETDGM